MHIRTVIALLSACAAPAARAQLFGVTSGGDLVLIDRTTGVGTVIGNSGFGANDACVDHAGHILSGGGNPDQIIAIDPTTGAGSIFLNTTGRPTGYFIRGMSVSPDNVLYVALSQIDTTTIDRLASIDMTTGAYTVIGPTGRTDIQALAFSPSGTLYAIGINNGGTLLQLDPTTGAATVIGGGNYGGDDQALTFLPDGTAYACRVGLRTVDPATGQTTLVGTVGGFDMRGLAFLAQSTPTCYPNCDLSTAPPILNANDFQCFLNQFAAGDSAANSDGSTAPPVLNANDFQCFLNAFAAGCS
jgi:hypothetical protein